MENRFENFTVTVMKLHKLIKQIKLFEMEEFGLKAVHVMCVYFIDRREKITAAELCKLTYEDKAAISRALAYLSGKGYIVYDAKKYNAPLALTEEGKTVADSIGRKASAAVDAGGGFLSEEERNTFYRVLDRIAVNLQDYYEKLNGVNA